MMVMFGVNLNEDQCPCSRVSHHAHRTTQMPARRSCRPWKPQLGKNQA